MARPHPLVLLLFCLLPALALMHPVPLGAQDPVQYTVRDVQGGYTWPSDDAAALPDLDFSSDRQPMTVLHDADLALLLPQGQAATVENAALILHDNDLLVPGAGSLLVRGWRHDPAERYETLEVELERGDRDREVAGRSAEHYELRARIHRDRSRIYRDQPDAEQEEQYEVISHLWILPDLPFSWAPFGFGTQTIPALMPGLREELEPQLAELGLVGRAIHKVDYRLIREDASAGGSTQLTGFEVSGIEPSEPPTIDRAIVDRELMAAVESRLMNAPAGVCAAVAEGEIPDLGVAIDDDVRAPLVDFLRGGCASPELYFGMMEEQFESDPEGVCETVLDAAGPDELASSLLTEAQADAFRTSLSGEQREAFHGELRGYCER